MGIYSSPEIISWKTNDERRGTYAGPNTMGEYLQPLHSQIFNRPLLLKLIDIKIKGMACIEFVHTAKTKICLSTYKNVSLASCSVEALPGMRRACFVLMLKCTFSLCTASNHDSSLTSCDLGFYNYVCL